MILHFNLYTHHSFGHVRISTHPFDIQVLRTRLQFDTSHDTIPVALCLVGHAMRVLSHAYILDTVVHLDKDIILLTQTDLFRHIIPMGHGETHLMSHLLAVDEDGGLYMRSFEEERDALSLPVLRYIDRAMIPRIAHVVFLRGEEEGELHIARLSISLHLGVIVIRRVVE